MLNAFLEALLQNASAKEITEIFLWSLLVVLVAAAVASRQGKATRFVSYAPTLLTSLGILGTFVGIVVGLMDFDATNIDGSIQGLLDGLKTAFITSLAGMGGAILFKVLSSTSLLMPPVGEATETTGAGPEDILKALNLQSKLLHRMQALIGSDEESSLVGQMKLSRADASDRHKEMVRSISEGTELLNRIQSTLGAEEESSLVGQLKLLRSDVGDHHKEAMKVAEEERERLDSFAEHLWKQLEAFAEMMSKSATEQVINALKEVISDFNKNLTEQFGENFKALDASVQRLVQWQENYRLQLEQMSTQYAQGVLAITQTETSVAHISEEARQIPLTMGELKAVMEVNQHQLAELERHLESFREMRDRAVAAVPEIRQQVESTVKDVAASAQAASDHYRKLLDLSDAYIEAHDQKTQALLDRFISTTDAGIAKVKEGLEQGVDSVKVAIITGAEEFDNSVQRVQANLTSTSDTLATQSDRIREQLEETVKDINSHVRDMVDTLARESRELLTALKDAGERTQRDTQQTQKQVADSIQQMQNRLESSLEELFQAQTRAMNSAVDGILKEMGNAVKTTGDGVNKQLGAIDTAMQQEVTRVMNEMGRALAQIAGQFTNDYAKLVRAMTEIVNKSRRSA